MTTKSANTTKTRRKPKTAWKPGQSGNPAGAPKRGESWAEIIKTVGDLTPEELVTKAVPQWLKAFKGMPKGVTFKELVVIRAFASLLDESSASLFNALMDRADGKVQDRVQVNDGDALKVVIEYANTQNNVAEATPGTDADKAGA